MRPIVTRKEGKERGNYDARMRDERNRAARGGVAVRVVAVSLRAGLRELVGGVVVVGGRDAVLAALVVLEADPAQPIAEREQQVVVAEVARAEEPVGLDDEVAVRLDLFLARQQQ